jgi:hypothetical protein
MYDVRGTMAAETLAMGGLRPGNHLYSSGGASGTCHGGVARTGHTLGTLVDLSRLEEGERRVWVLLQVHSEFESLRRRGRRLAAEHYEWRGRLFVCTLVYPLRVSFRALWGADRCIDTHRE